MLFANPRSDMVTFEFEDKFQPCCVSIVKLSKFNLTFEKTIHNYNYH